MTLTCPSAISTLCKGWFLTSVPVWDLVLGDSGTTCQCSPEIKQCQVTSHFIPSDSSDTHSLWAGMLLLTKSLMDISGDSKPSNAQVMYSNNCSKKNLPSNSEPCKSVSKRHLEMIWGSPPQQGDCISSACHHQLSRADAIRTCCQASAPVKRPGWCFLERPPSEDTVRNSEPSISN